MRAQVMYEGAAVGTVEWTETPYGAEIALDCAIPCEPLPLLRCYARTAGAPLLVGLPEPSGGRLVLKRRLSRETLKAAGCAAQPPASFFLSENGQEQQTTPPALAQAAPPSTGDAVLDSLLGQQGVRWTAAEDTVELRCAFAPDKPFPLAPAFVLCTVQQGEAVLRWTKKDAAGRAASP